MTDEIGGQHRSVSWSPVVASPSSRRRPSSLPFHPNPYHHLLSGSHAGGASVYTARPTPGYTLTQLEVVNSTLGRVTVGVSVAA
jgi:hypothetical protein